MKYTKHTAGKWKVDPKAKTRVHTDDRTIATTGSSNNTQQEHEENLANAILIASAKDMLEALEKAEYKLGQIDSVHYSNVKTNMHNVINDLQQAIKSARGES